MAKTQVKPDQILTTYTATEQDTGKTWVDGRPIYRKVLRGQVTVAAGTNNIAHGITGITNSFELVSFNAFTKLGQSSGSGSSGMQIYHRETGGNWCSFGSIDNTQVGLISSFAWGNTYYGITMEYVK